MVECKKQYLKSRFNILPLESSPSIIATVSSKVKIFDEIATFAAHVRPHCEMT